MGTLGEVKARIAREVDRTDLTTDIAAMIDRAIEFYAPKRFWWTDSIATTTTVADNEYVALPAGLRHEDPNDFGVFVNLGGDNTFPLIKITRGELQYWQSVLSNGGQPYYYAVENERYRVFPTPNAAYVITVVGIYDITAPADDNSSNDWTNYAEDLIVGRVKFLLARDRTYDNGMMSNARAQEIEALERLQSETIDRKSTGRIRPGW